MSSDVVLLHGGAHGAWCWERLIPLLERGGARVTAPDLPLSDPGAGFAECLRTILAAVPEDCHAPLVVAHSASGSYLPLAAKVLKARRMAFLCAVLPREGASWVDQLMEDPTCVVLPPPQLQVDEQGRVVFPPSAAESVFFHDCTPSDRRWAVARMVPFAQTVPSEVLPVGAMVGAPSAEYILGSLDRSLDPRWLRREAEERFGKPCIEIDTGHSPFLSDPAGLAEILLAL